jgi:hypothetical protein
MSRRDLPKHSRKQQLRRLAALVGCFFGLFVFAMAVLYLGFGPMILNGYAKAKAERAFAAAHPGCVLRIGALDYSAGANCLVVQSVTVSGTNSTLKTGRISLTGVRWSRVLWGRPSLAEALSRASIDATNLNLAFSQTDYGIRCARLRASVPDADLFAEGTELRAMVTDEEFFAAHVYRTTRFHVIAPECRVSGLAYGELLEGKGYRARAIHLFRPSFESLVNRDQPLKPFEQPPLMVHEALAAIRPPLKVDRLTITNGYVKYCERVVTGEAPGELTFTAVAMAIEGISSRGLGADAIELQAQGNLMGAATLKVRMTIPVAPPDFSFHYSGSLGPMDLTRLDAFLDTAEHTRIKSGTVKEAAFEINVQAGHARGRVRANYRDLTIAVLDKEIGTDDGLKSRVASFLANVLKIRNASAPGAAGAMREGMVTYTRRPQEEFLQFAWFALRSGVMDVITY